MNKKLIAAVAVFFFADGFSTCADAPKVEQDSIPEINEPAAGKAPTLSVYIDASGSMRGYFAKTADNAPFVTAVARLAAYGAGSTVQFYGSQKTLNTAASTGTGLLGELIAGAAAGQDSYFDVMLAKLAKQAASGAVACLVTDGIIGASNAQTATDPDYILKNMQLVEDNIAAAITSDPKKKVGVSVYRLTSGFDATAKAAPYLDYQNRHIAFRCAARPFFVIAVGQPADLRRLLADNPLQAAATAALHFGLHDALPHLRLLSDDEHFPGGLWRKQPKGQNVCRLKADLPACMPADTATAKWLLTRASATLNGKPLPADAIRIDGRQVSLTVDMDSPTISIAPANRFALTIKGGVPSRWAEWSCNDDRAIKTNIILQNQTFALDNLLQGLAKGTGQANDDTIITATLNFKKQ